MISHKISKGTSKNKRFKYTQATRGKRWMGGHCSVHVCFCCYNGKYVPDQLWRCWCCQHAVTFLHAHIRFVTSGSVLQAYQPLCLVSYTQTVLGSAHVLKKEREGRKEGTNNPPRWGRHWWRRAELRWTDPLKMLLIDIISINKWDHCQDNFHPVMTLSTGHILW